MGSNYHKRRVFFLKPYVAPPLAACMLVQFYLPYEQVFSNFNEIQAKDVSEAIISDTDLIQRTTNNDHLINFTEALRITKQQRTFVPKLNDDEDKNEPKYKTNWVCQVRISPPILIAFELLQRLALDAKAVETWGKA